MVIEKYGIKLKRLEQQDIEMVRCWRNSNFVQQYMEYRNHITIKMQKKWFANLGTNNYYFIVYFKDYPIGLTYIKNVRKDIGYFGIFIADEESLQNLPMISYKMMISMLDLSFETLNLNYVEATILESNPRAARFNISVGFQMIKNKSSSKKQYYLLTKDVYKIKSNKIKNIIERT